MHWREVAAEVERIRSIADDAEAAHAAEDELWFQVLTALAYGEECPLAEEAIKTRDIKFGRYCS